MTEQLDPSFKVQLTKVGVFKDGKPDPDWFTESCERSKGFVALGKVESDKELARILDGTDLDDL